MDWSEDLGRYVAHLEARQWTAKTIYGQRKALNRFFLFVWRSLREKAGEAAASPADVTRAMVERYVEATLLEPSPRTGKVLASGSRHCYLSAVKAFYAWMEKEGLVLVSPAADVELPRVDKNKRVRPILSEKAVAKLVEAPNVSTPLGIRDRAILEVFYSTALRLAEMAGLSIYDVDAAGGLLQVREGKGKKGRVVPLGKTAAYYVTEYVTNVRSRYAKKKRHAPTALFLSMKGEPMTPKSLRTVVYKAARAAGVKASPHAIRRSTSTHLLASGAPPELVQELLGHSSGYSLRFYARLFGPELKEEHERTHPRETEGLEESEA